MLSPFVFSRIYMAKKVKESKKEVSIDAQEQLVEILNDSPRFVSLVGTQW